MYIWIVIEQVSKNDFDDKYCKLLSEKILEFSYHI